METFAIIEDIRNAADRYEEWQLTGVPCEECQDYARCSSCSVLFEYEIAMAIVVATLCTMEGHENNSTKDILWTANVLVDANWIIRYGEKWGETL